MSLCVRCRKRDATKSWCKECHRQYSKERRDRMRGGAGRERRSTEEVQEGLKAGKKFCPGCRQVHPLECFPKDATRFDGRKTKCQLCDA